MFEGAGLPLALIAGGLALYGLLFFWRKRAGRPGAIKNTPGTTTSVTVRDSPPWRKFGVIILLFVILAAVYYYWAETYASVGKRINQPELSEFWPFRSSCPKVGELADVIEVTEGQRLTVKKGCPVFINQRQFAETGFILDAVDERFREYKPGQLINTAQKFPGVERYPACVIDSKKVVRGSRCHMVQVSAVEWAYNELGLEAVHFIVRKPKSEKIILRLTL